MNGTHLFIRELNLFNVSWERGWMTPRKGNNFEITLNGFPSVHSTINLNFEWFPESTPKSQSKLGMSSSLKLQPDLNLNYEWLPEYTLNSQFKL